MQKLKTDNIFRLEIIGKLSLSSIQRSDKISKELVTSWFIRALLLQNSTSNSMLMETEM